MKTTSTKIGTSEIESITFNERGRIARSDSFFRGYLEAALWNDEDEYLGRTYRFEDIAQATFQQMFEDCTRFQEDNGHLINDENCHYRGCPVEEYAGHDFWLTRNHHGCGFWDGHWEKEVGNRLTQAAQKFPKVNLYEGDDGLIHGA